MAWKKSSPELVAKFVAALPADPRAERRKMFGYPCCFVNDNMFAGLHEERMVLRLDPVARAELLAEPGASVFEPMPGRPMKEYVVVPPAVLASAPLLERWTMRSFSWASSLPPKKRAKKSRARRAVARLAAVAAAALVAVAPATAEAVPRKHPAPRGARAPTVTATKPKPAKRRAPKAHARRPAPRKRARR
jgi:TfoX/Sxy family transcriptional regulator of competence genes